MLAVKIGESVRVKVRFRGDNGQIVATTGVEVRARPDGGSAVTIPVSADPSVINGWICSFTPDTAGTWLVYGKCSGPSPGFTPIYYFRAEPVPF